jgi:dihydroxyacetone kinase-like protein
MHEDSMDVADLVAALHLCTVWLVRDEAELTELDRAIGDGDHGHNMRIGFEAVREELQSGQAHDVDLGTLMSLTGLTLLSAVGGASGPLYSAAFIAAGLALEGSMCAGPHELAGALQAACRGVARRGHCFPGDKTLLDTLQPAADALKTASISGLTMAAGLEAMRESACQGMRSTIPMLARCGLAMRYGPRSIGHQDPGATSCYLILNAVAYAWTERRR